jgi:hypothetical protein
MPKSALVRHGPAVALGLLTVVGGVAFAVPLTWPGRWAAEQPRLAAVSEARATRAATATPVDLPEIRAQTLAVLAERPLDSVAWARLAWIAAEQDDMEAARDALDRSYVAAPYGPEVTAWRLRFALDLWGRLTPELRRQVLAELRMTAATRPAIVETVRDQVRDPAGRWALDLMVPEPL